MAAIPLDLLDRIRELERKVRELTGRAQIRPALNEITSGPVKIAEGGSLEVRAPDGTGIFGVGRLWDGDFGVAIQRSDATLAFNVGGSGEGSNMIRTFSRAGAVILMDDYYSPEFLGRPWMPIQLFPTKQQGTEGTTYQYAWVGGAPAHNAVAVITLSSIASPSGGQVRVNMLPPGGGEVAVAEYDVPPRTWVNKTITQPLHRVGYQDYVGWNIQHRVTGADSGIETRVFHAYTRNTFSADEAPDPPPFGAAAAARGFTGVPEGPPPEKPSAPAEPGWRTIDD
ncbi:hypothetical protein ACFTWH_00330 [Streptomyces sp. NPDC057011]|uniref:hypothetical protein n=1 Tax=unclassified Streptomyces TaxID=2593676 RepID=UPI0036353E16